MITFVNRLRKIGIEVKISFNVPWIYIDSINGKRVKEKRYSKYGYTVAFMPIKKGQNIKFLDLRDTFNLIRKYNNMEQKRKKVAEWMNALGYEFDLSDGFWMEDYDFTEHKNKDVIDLILDYNELSVINNNRNLLNFLKSELSVEQNKKLDKVIDYNKIQFIRKIITYLK